MSGAENQSRMDRNLREKQRRLHFKDLFARLNSLLPYQSSRVTVLGSLDQAINYVRQSQERTMMLRKRLEQLRQKEVPEISVTSIENELEVNFKLTKWNRSKCLQEVVHAIEEEGAAIISLNYIAPDGLLLGTIHAKAIYARIGIEISNVKERLGLLSSQYN